MRHIFILLLLTLVIVLHVAAQPTKKTQKAIICLTYDDGLESHLSTVVPELDSFDFKATFFLNAIKGSAEVIGQASPALIGWQNAARNGHELGNHTLFHPCPESLGWQKNVAIEQYSVGRIMQEVRAMDELLDLVDNKKTPRPFAYPCNNSLVEGKDYSSTLQKEGFLYGRTGGDRNSVVKDFRALDVMHVPSWLVEEDATAKELMAFAEKARASSGMAVYQFHGIGGQFFKVSKEAHRQLLQYLKDNQQYYQVLTFSDAMKQIALR